MPGVSGHQYPRVHNDDRGDHGITVFDCAPDRISRRPYPPGFDRSIPVESEHPSTDYPLQETLVAKPKARFRVLVLFPLDSEFDFKKIDRGSPGRVL